LKIDWVFLRLVVYCALGAIGLVIIPLALLSEPAVVRSVVASGAASLFHLLVGYALIEFGFDKSNTTFLKKISHSSHELRTDNIKGSFNGSDIMVVYEGG